MILASHGIIASSGVSQFDTDAQAFITAASISDSTQQTAINSLVTDLKTYNIWNKMKALYPFVGGSASTHKWNLKDPRDLDAAYRLVFNGGWTHSSTGALPNGTNAYADTYLTPSAVQSFNNNGLGYYTYTLNSTSSVDPAPIGSYNGPSQSSTIGFPTSNNKILSHLNGNLITSSTISPIGLISAHKTSSTLTTLYRNSTNVGSGNSGGALPTYPVFFGTANVDGVAYNLGYVNTEFRLVYISDGFSQTEVTNLYDIIQKFQTTLSRNI